MLTKRDLKKITQHRLKDSCILLQNKRYGAAMYLAGYAIELTLKRNICHIFRFNNGFPEYQAEFDLYRARTTGENALFLITVRQLRQIKTHNLSALLEFSGRKPQVERHCADEWLAIKDWGPDQRYSARIVRSAAAAAFMDNCKTVLKYL